MNYVVYTTDQYGTHFHGVFYSAPQAMLRAHELRDTDSGVRATAVQAVTDVTAVPVSRTNPGIGPGSWDSGALARAQENWATVQLNGNPTPKASTYVWDSTYKPTPMLYRLYTENVGDIAEIVLNYFDSATLIPATGLWKGGTESAMVIEFIGTPADMQRVAFLASAIKFHNNQSEVIVTWTPVSVLKV